MKKKELLLVYIARIFTRECFEKNEYLHIDIGFHQGLALSPFLFTIVMDGPIRETQNEVTWCMLFVDDIVLIDETRDGLSEKLEK